MKTQNINYRTYFYLKCILKLAYSNLVMIKNFQPTPKIEEKRITRIRSSMLFHSLFLAPPMEHIYRNKCSLDPHIYWIRSNVVVYQFPSSHLGAHFLHSEQDPL
jgi:hypothetical protein